MCKKIKLLGIVFVMVGLMAAISGLEPLFAASASDIDRKVDGALENLFAHSPAAKELSKTAKGILVFPDVVKAGLLVGGEYGVGALRKGGKTAGYYRVVEASYGLQAGAQSFGYALFFVTEDALEYLDKSEGFELGTGPTLVVADEGFSKSLTTSTLKDDIYAFFFDEKGLMGGLGLKGSKITKFTPDE